jgi:antitoxin component of RelBE/YafQ-DinJ toxin-antitoxin module
MKLNKTQRQKEQRRRDRKRRVINLEEQAHYNCEHIPNAETIESIENAENGIGLEEVENVDELFENLEK